MKKDSLGNRMKDNYENRAKQSLTRRMPVIMRLDGKAFHSFTKKMQRPYDYYLKQMMVLTTIELCKEIQGAKLAYTQSDEISILITDYDKFTTDAWFDYSVQKMTSVSASIATAWFNKFFIDCALEDYAGEFQTEIYEESLKYVLGVLSNRKLAYFDSRVFNIPKEEVANYFLWRFKDWERNSIQLLAQSLFSQKELHKKNKADLHEMCFQKGHNWNDLEPVWKNGSFILYSEDKGWYCENTLNLNDDRKFIEDIVYCGEE